MFVEHITYAGPVTMRKAMDGRGLALSGQWQLRRNKCILSWVTPERRPKVTPEDAAFLLAGVASFDTLLHFHRIGESFAS